MISFFLLIYKTTPTLSDLWKLSSDESIWGRPIASSFSTTDNDKDNIDGDTVTSHVVCEHYVVVNRPTGLGNDDLNLYSGHKGVDHESGFTFLPRITTRSDRI